MSSYSVKLTEHGYFDVTPNNVSEIKEFNRRVNINAWKWKVEDFDLLKDFQILHLEGGDFINDEAISKLENVEDLSIVRCNGRTLFNGIQVCDECIEFYSYEDNKDISVVKIVGVTGTGLRNLKKLKKLLIEYCDDFTTLEFEHKDSIEELKLRGVDNINVFKSLVNLKNLKKLEIDYHNDNITNEILGELVQLESIDFGVTIQQVTGSCLKRLKNLKELKILFDDNITDKMLSELVNLESLEIGSKNLTGSCFKELKKLRNLKLLSCSNHFINESLGWLTNLESLDIANLNRSITGNSFKELKNLKKLDIHIFNNISNDCIENLTNLEYLNVSSNKITDEAFEKLTNLKELSVLCQYVTERIFDNLKNLEHVTILDTLLDRSFDALSKLENLKEVSVHRREQSDSKQKKLNKNVKVRYF